MGKQISFTTPLRRTANALVRLPDWIDPDGNGGSVDGRKLATSSSDRLWFDPTGVCVCVCEK